MRKGLLLILVVFLFGCTAQQAETPIELEPELSTMFMKKGVDKMFDDSAAIRNRLNNLRVNELEAIRFILNDELNETAMEYSITDQAIIHKFKELLEAIKVVESYDAEEALPKGSLFAFEVSVKDKDPIVFKGNDYGFCLTKDTCVYLTEKIQLYEFFKEYAVEGIPVYPVDLDEITVNFDSWAESAVEEFEEDEQLFEKEDLGSVVYNAWYSTYDPWDQALKMAFYFNEEFEDYHTIKNWDKVVGGLAIQLFEQGYRRDNYGSDFNTYYGPQGDTVTIKIDEHIMPAHSLQPDRFVTYSMIEKVGSVLFGSDFVIPEIGAENLADYQMFTVKHSRSQKLCSIHSPYEYFFATLETGLILAEEIEGNKRTYDLLIYTETMETPDDGKSSHSLADVYIVYRNDLNEPYDTIKGNEEHFKQVRIELEEIEEGIRINSFKFLNKLEQLDKADTATKSDSDDIETNSATSTDTDQEEEHDAATITDSSTADTFEEALE